jgi:hypothetical protein
MGIHQKINSTQSKTHVEDLKDGAVLIPFIECLWDVQTLDLARNKCIQQGLSPTIVSWRLYQDGY